jgi:putative oxidoreductase
MIAWRCRSLPQLNPHKMTGSPTDLLWPQLGVFYQAVAPWTMTLLRVFVGCALVPHGLRSCFGLFPGTGGSPPRIPGVSRFKQSCASLKRQGYWPAPFWSVVVTFIQFGAAPMVALGLFTRPMSLLMAIFFLNGVVAHLRWGHGWFWNTQGIEYPLMWLFGTLFFAFAGGGPISLDHLLLGWAF